MSGDNSKSPPPPPPTKPPPLNVDEDDSVSNSGSLYTRCSGLTTSGETEGLDGEHELSEAERVIELATQVYNLHRSEVHSRGASEQSSAQVDVHVQPPASGSVGVQVDGVPRLRRGKRGRFERAEPCVRTDRDMSWLVQGQMSGGPADGSVIPSFGGHIASCIWKGSNFERDTLRTYNRGTTFVQLQKWMESMGSEVRKVVEHSGLAHLPGVMMSHIDAPLISAFVERWQPDTNSFHMPFGEMTILLHDVSAILRLPIDGLMVSSTGEVHDDGQIDLHQHFCELLQVTVDELLAEPKALWDNGGVSVAGILDASWRKKKRAPDLEACGFLLTVLGTTLFADKSGNRILPANILELRSDLRGVNKYSWGSATLAYLYRQLGLASRSGCTGIAGCLTLLQAWIYEYFPCFRLQKLAICADNARAAMWDSGKPGKEFHRLQSYRLRIDQLTAREVNWLPYSPHPETLGQRTLIPGWVGYRDILEPYLPDRVIRQFGYIQGIPDLIPHPLKVRRPAAVKAYELVFSRPTVLSQWSSRSSLRALNFKDIPRIDSREGAPFGPAFCTNDYMDWYETHSHPRVTPDDSLLSANKVVSSTKTDYWVNYAIDCMRGLMANHPNKSCDEYLKCEQFMVDWQNSEGV